MTEANLKILRSIRILSDLDKASLELLYSHMHEEFYPAGRPIFQEGDAGDTMYVVIKGVVSILVNTDDGETIEIAEIPAGNFLGEMSIFDNAPRSATCTPKTDTAVLSLKSESFYSFIEKNPEAGNAIMHPMLKTITQRLKNTAAFLSDMVTWGEQARIRAITDDFTGLYNRRFLDDAVEERINEAESAREPLSLVMADLDHFGKLNTIYGTERADRLLLEFTEVCKKTFRDEDILARYGGDEFVFLLPGTEGREALALGESLNTMLADIKIPPAAGEKDKSLEPLQPQKISASIGISSYPEHGHSPEELKSFADKALYEAKEEGRSRVRLWKDYSGEPPGKTVIKTIRKRNRIIFNILEAMDQREGFLVMGHKDPDEDCISSMIAMALLLNKFSKTAYVIIPRKINENFRFLLNICRYNAIGIIHTDEKLPEDISTVFIMDTPKPPMREEFPGRDELFDDLKILKVEIDHHLEADSRYNGDRGYCFVDEASSACELVGMLALKLNHREDLLESYNIEELLSRNFVLAVLSGVIGDSKMGKYLKTDREKWYYRLFSSLFSDLLSSVTRKDSRNFSSMKEVFNGLQQLSMQEDACFTLMMKQKVEFSPKIGTVIIPEDVIDEMKKQFDHDTIVTVARYTADSLAEHSRLLSLVAYRDDQPGSDLIQFRIRRSHSYKDLDLRLILERFGIENGGGHPGAIGFRFPTAEIENLPSYIESIIPGIEELMNDAAAE